MLYHSKCLEFIQTRRQHYLNLIIELASINTHSYNSTGLHTCLNLIQNLFQFPESKYILHDLKPHITALDNGSLVEHPLGRALEISSPDRTGSPILLAGHYDTVFLPSSSFQKAVVENGTMNGPGVADMKGGLIVLLAAMEAYEACYRSKKTAWKILITPDEEIGSPGSKQLYKQVSSGCKAALIYEPAFADGYWADKRSGSCSLTIVVHGRAAHAGRDYEKGRSALLAFSPILSALESLPQICSEKIGSPVIINVGKLHAGTAHNIVPDFCIARINIRSLALEGMLLAKKSIEELLSMFGHKEGIEMKIVNETFHPPKPLDSKTEKLFGQLAKCAKQLDTPMQTRISYGATDGNDLASYGIPTLDSMGVVGGGLHTENEYMDVDQFTSRALLSALLLAELSVEASNL